MTLNKQLQALRSWTGGGLVGAQASWGIPEWEDEPPLYSGLT
jgi:hypothetical protein